MRAIKSDFELGEVVVTAAVDRAMKEDKSFRDFVYKSLGRYAKRDWGEMDEEDKEANDDAVLSGEDRIFASYKRPGNEEKIWIITEWDHSVTTILFPEDY